MIFACPLRDCQTICADEVSFQSHFNRHLAGHLPGDLNSLLSGSADAAAVASIETKPTTDADAVLTKRRTADIVRPRTSTSNYLDLTCMREKFNRTNPDTDTGCLSHHTTPRVSSCHASTHRSRLLSLSAGVPSRSTSPGPISSMASQFSLDLVDPVDPFVNCTATTKTAGGERRRDMEPLCFLPPSNDGSPHPADLVDAWNASNQLNSAEQVGDSELSSSLKFLSLVVLASGSAWFPRVVVDHTMNRGHSFIDIS